MTEKSLFQADLDYLGAAATSQPLSPSQLSSLADRFPPAFAQYLTDNGYGYYENGLVQFCDADDYRPILEVIFGDDPDLKPERSHIVFFSAFGTLTGWSEDFGHFEADLVTLTVNCDGVRGDVEKRIPGVGSLAPSEDPDILARSLLPMDAELVFDMLGADEELLWERCVNMHGAPEVGQCFGFFPALALGGLALPENVKRVKSFEHFVLLAQLGQFTLTRTNADFDEEPVRPIG